MLHVTEPRFAFDSEGLTELAWPGAQGGPKGPKGPSRGPGSLCFAEEAKYLRACSVISPRSGLGAAFTSLAPQISSSHRMVCLTMIRAFGCFELEVVNPCAGLTNSGSSHLSRSADVSRCQDMTHAGLGHQAGGGSHGEVRDKGRGFRCPGILANNRTVQHATQPLQLSFPSTVAGPLMTDSAFSAHLTHDGELYHVDA